MQPRGPYGECVKGRGQIGPPTSRRNRCTLTSRRPWPRSGSGTGSSRRRWRGRPSRPAAPGAAGRWAPADWCHRTAAPFRRRSSSARSRSRTRAAPPEGASPTLPKGGWPRPTSAPRRARRRRDTVRARVRAGQAAMRASQAAVGPEEPSEGDGILVDMSARMSSPVLVGRAEQLASLDAALGRAREGGPSTLLIGGEAGIGKTRLVSEFVATARQADARVLAGGCMDLGADGLPFAPFAAVLRELVHDLGTDGVAALLPAHATRELARLLPEFGEADPATDPAVARARLFEQMLTLLERLAEAGPVVLIIEDAHWADRSTRDLVAFLVGSQQVIDRVLIVVTYRSDELHRTHPLRPLLAELSRLSWVERMELPRLGRLQADELAAHITGREPDPLFVEELLCCDGGLSAELPESLRDLLLAGVQRLPEETQELLRAASAGGQRTGHALLAAVTGLAGDDLTPALRPAVAANVLRADEDGYAFRHALIGEAIYDDLLPGERTR